MFLVHFRGEWHSGNQKVPGSNPTDGLRQTLELNLTTTLPVTFWWNSVAINIGWVRLPLCQWPKFGLRAAKWLIKKVWKNFVFCSSVFVAVFHKQVNIHFSIGSISRPISSRDHKATDHAIAMGRYKSYFRKLDIFFSGKQQGAIRTDQKIYSLLINNFWMVVTILKLSTSLSICLITQPSLAQQRK